MYCKCFRYVFYVPVRSCINSSKVYCKSIFFDSSKYNPYVLIVAKCIVNSGNSLVISVSIIVLIVAKCIVNYLQSLITLANHLVLIVAKCIVNFIPNFVEEIGEEGINSSKVYCKLHYENLH